MKVFLNNECIEMSEAEVLELIGPELAGRVQRAEASGRMFRTVKVDHEAMSKVAEGKWADGVFVPYVESR